MFKFELLGSIARIWIIWLIVWRSPEMRPKGIYLLYTHEMNGNPADTKRYNNVTMTSTEVATSVWRDNDAVITSCVRWETSATNQMGTALQIVRVESTTKQYHSAPSHHMNQCWLRHKMYVLVSTYIIF